MYITVKVKDRWLRGIVGKNPLQCKSVNTGKTFNFSRTNEHLRIFELDHRLLVLPARAILCGLGKVLQISSRENYWTEQACQMFKTLTKGRQLRAYFLQQGLFSNSFYIFLSSNI